MFRPIFLAQKIVANNAAAAAAAAFSFLLAPCSFLRPRPQNASAFISSLHASLHIFPQTETARAGREIEIERWWDGKPSLMLRVSFPVRHFVTKLYFQFVHILHTACHAPSSGRWPTYLAFVFIFSEIVLFLRWQLLWPAGDPQSCKCPCPGPCLLIIFCRVPSSVFHPASGAVDYYYRHYDRISLG